MIEAQDSLMPVIDDVMSIWIENYCNKESLPYSLKEFADTISAGAKPETTLAEKDGIKLGPTGAVKEMSF